MQPECEICSAAAWLDVYSGPIRDGVFGKLREGATVRECSCCGVQRLDETYCMREESYEDARYRTHLEQEAHTAGNLQLHDGMQIHALNAIWPRSLRGLCVADIGCAGGSFLDHISGVAGHLIAIEPSAVYHTALAARGYVVCPYARDAGEHVGTVDFATSFQVIEHTASPRHFLEEIRPLLKAQAPLLISTPNRDDILMETLPEYRSFFYRVVHRWYFNASSIARCAALSGYEVVEVRHYHKYGLANFLLWLRDKRPSGNSPLLGVDACADQFWKGYLEANGSADTLFAVLIPRA